MTARPRWALALLLAGAASAAFAQGQVELYPGVARDFVLGPQPEPRLLDGLSFVVPPGAEWAALELAASDPAHDLDLYVRFAGRVTEGPGGQILADHASATPGGGPEHVLLSPSSSPPMQTGRYYAGVVVRTLQAEVRFKLRLTLRTGAEPAARIVSTFDIDDEGWRLNFPPSDIPGATLGDPGAALARDPAGFLRVLAPGGSARDFLVAPPKFLGDLSRFSRPRFRFDFRYVQGGPPAFRSELRLLGAGSVYQWLGDVPEAGNWLRVEVPLEAAAWRRLFGPAAFSDVLRNVERIEISMDHSAGPETSDFDNFEFTGREPEPPPGPGGPRSSDFESGLDGWTRNYPASPIPGATVGSENAGVFAGLGGRNSERCLLMVSGAGRDMDWAVAPDKFIAGLADLERPWYEFWYRHADGAQPLLGVRLRLLGGGSVYEWTGARARSSWERFRAPIDARNWVHVSGPDDFAGMLRRVQRLEVGMDNGNGYESNCLDDFHLRVQFTPPEGPALRLGSEELSLQVAPGSSEVVRRRLTVEASGADVDWSATVEPAGAGWLSISKTAGRTPDAVEVAVDPRALAPGLYRADVVVRTSHVGVAERRMSATLIVGEDPRVPALSSGGAVHAAEPRIPLSAGALGSLFGRFLADAERSPGFVAGTDRLPTRADGVEVWVADPAGGWSAAAPLVYLSPGQINFQMPWEAAGRPLVLVSVVRHGVESNRLAVELAEAGPGIFVAGERAAVVNADGRTNAADAPAESGSFVTAYFTGTGAVAPRIDSGRAAPAEALSSPTGGLTAEIDGAAVRVLGAALAPGFVGLGQMSVAIPPGLTPGRRLLRIAIGGRFSNAVFVWIR